MFARRLISAQRADPAGFRMQLFLETRAADRRSGSNCALSESQSAVE